MVSIEDNTYQADTATHTYVLMCPTCEFLFFCQKKTATFSYFYFHPGGTLGVDKHMCQNGKHTQHISTTNLTNMCVQKTNIRNKSKRVATHLFLKNSPLGTRLLKNSPLGFFFI